MDLRSVPRASGRCGWKAGTRDARLRAMDPLLSSRIGPYRLLRLLGEGGMSRVYLAEPAAGGQPVALKTVHVPDETLLPRLRREIWALSRIRHPGIVRIFDSGIHEGVPWYAMEVLEGTTLQKYRAQLPTDEFAPILEAATRPDRAGYPEAPGPDPTEARSPQVEAGAQQVLHRHALKAILTVVRRLCAALAYLHGEGIVHRDLEPDQVLVRAGGGERR